MKDWKRLLSLAMCICLLLSMMPNWTIGVHAEDDEAEQTVVQEEQAQEETEAVEEPAEEKTEQAEEPTEQEEIEEESEEDDTTGEEEHPENSEKEDNEKQYPWDGMTDEEFYEWVMHEENQQLIMLIFLDENENLYEALFNRIQNVTNEQQLNEIEERISILFLCKSNDIVLHSDPYGSGSFSPLSVSELKRLYPDGKYWNHFANEQADLPVKYFENLYAESVTSTPCASHSSPSVGTYVCNSFDMATQCTGFARRLGYLASGGIKVTTWTAYSSSKYDNATLISKIKPGDVVRYSYNGVGHDVFVTAKTGTTIEGADCNYAGKPCIIKWDWSRNLNNSSYVISTVYSNPTILSDGGGTGGSGSTSGEYTGGPNATWEEYKPYCKSITPINGTITQKSTSKVKVYTLPWTDQRNGVTHVPYYELEIEDICVANKIVNHLGGDHIWYQLKYPATQSEKTYQFVYSGDVVFTEESITFNTFSTPELGSNSATIKIYIQNPNQLTMDKAGFILSTGDLTGVKIESESDLSAYQHKIESFPKNYINKQTNIFYSIGDGKDLNYKLTPGTKYYVRFYIIDSTGKVHMQDGQSFFITTGTHTHSWGSWTKADATNHKRNCSVCGAVETAAHSWNSGTVTKAATCAATGVKTYTCTVCNATKTETIAKLTSHTWGSWTKVDDTNHKRTCTVCGTAETAAHSWGSWAAVTGTNNHKRTCSACGTAETAIHSFSYVENPKPTATSTGTITGTCNTCKYVITDTFPVISDNDYVRTVFQEPSYSEKGYSKYTWKNTAYGDRCFVIQDIPALKAVTKITLNVTDITICKDQEFILSATVAPSDAENKGVHWKTSNANVATRNFNTQTVHANGVGTAVFTAEADDYQGAVATCTVHVVDHDWSYSEVITEATCNADGVMKYTCSLCQGSKTETIAKLTSHTWGSWTKADEVNHKRVCSVCSTEDMQLHECSYSVTKEPTKAVQGTLTGVCSRCSGTKQIALPALNQNDYSYLITKEPTLSATGVGRYTWKNTTYGTFSFEAEIPMLESENTTRLVLGSARTAAGKEVVIPIEIKDNSGIGGLAITMSYNKSVFTLKSVSNGGMFDSLSSGVNITLDNSGNVTGDGVIATLTFVVNENAQEGEYPISAVVRSCVDEDGKDVPIKVNAGTVTIVNVVYGDANGDEKIDMKDVVLLRKYITNFDYDTGVSSVATEAGADANGDGKIDMKDVVLLRKYITNYDYDTGTSTVVLGPQ